MTHFLSGLILPAGDDQNAPAIRTRTGKRCGILGIFANLLLFSGKLIIALCSGSVSIAADATNNLSDAMSSVITLWGFKLSERPPDSSHPYGHARYEYITGLCISGMILVIGFELARTSLVKILHPEPLVFSRALVVVLLLSIGVKLILSRIQKHLGDKIDSTALLATSADSRNDCVATAFVLFSALTTQFTAHNIDGYTGLAVAVMILVSGIQIAHQAISPLLGESNDPETQKHIVDTLRSSDKILGFHDLMVHDYGPGRRFASVHVEMDLKEDPLVCHTIISHIENKVLSQFGIHLVIHYDPMVTDDEEQNQMKSTVKKVLRSMDDRISIHDFRLIRENGVNSLIFDMVLPDELSGREEKVKQMLDTAINLGENQYQTYITFDAAGTCSEDFRG